MCSPHLKGDSDILKILSNISFSGNTTLLEKDLNRYVITLAAPEMHVRLVKKGMAEEREKDIE